MNRSYLNMWLGHKSKAWEQTQVQADQTSVKRCSQYSSFPYPKENSLQDTENLEEIITIAMLNESRCHAHF